MSLTPIARAPKTHKIAVYDLEWVPETYELRLAGFFDGQRYRSFPTIEGLLNVMLSPTYKHHLFLAHAGGLADQNFLLGAMQRVPELRVTAAFSGSSAIVVKVKWRKDTYTFLDSYWLLRDKLAHLAPFVGAGKKSRGSWKCASYPECGHVGRACASAPECGCEPGPEPLCMFRAPYAILRDYNEQDCRILYAAVDAFQTQLNEMGTEMRSTIASTALGLFRTEYLSEKIETSPARNDALRASYIASRVEVIRPRLMVPGNYYDVNSSFPFAMTKPCPGAYLGQSRRLPKEPELYFADATVSVPDMFLPPLGARGKDGRIYFPTGRWRGLFARPDLELLQEAGGRIERVHEVTRFAPFTDLAAYALDLYERRRVAKREGKLFLALLIKFLLNACYGKFGEHREKEQMVMHPYSELCPHDGAHDFDTDEGITMASCVEPLFPGCILVSEERSIPHEHVAIASHITSVARATLYRYMRQCGEDIYYCDTDSVVTCAELPTGSALGELKLEHRLVPGEAGSVAAEFAQPKLYRMTIAEEGGTRTVQVKSKGFSRLSSMQFSDLIAGREVEVERMYRVKEFAREHKRFGAAGKKFDKRIRLGASRPKRQAEGESTRPWTWKEIQERWRPAC